MEEFRFHVYPSEDAHATLFIFSPCLDVAQDYSGKKMWAGEEA